ncbi:MAG: hypothetical protein EZS28_020168 [Streblomastix strix]|uniref:Uncharacterized protein n=1 Tax=Streblomastix strix TaxID=222440 RepID=A0A5J4VNS1_9EUKA|nr:MAG: hypothetical protein EZS28_020168 [Streblomastix strix]
MQGDVFNVGPGELVLIGDFKENIHLPLEIDQEGYQYYEQAQITCLSIVAHTCNLYGLHVKRVYTLLSRCLTHTAGFVLKCLRLVLEQPEFQDIQHATWWSDGGPHFRCKELVYALLSNTPPFLPNCSFSVNFFAPQHGKSEVDGAFGFFSRLMRVALPEQGVESLNELLTFFENQTKMYKNADIENRQKYKFFKINCTRLPSKAKKLVISNFKECLSFTKQDDMLVSAPESAADEESKVFSPFKFKLEEVASKVKTSTASEENPKVFDDVVNKQLKSLQKSLSSK